jgi:AAA15 family ATPase/GTPase
MVEDVTQSYKRDEKHDLIEPYIFSAKSENEPCEFEVCINVEDKEYRYGFTRDQVKVYKEWLFEKKFAKNTRAKEKCVYFRDTDTKKLITDSISAKEKEEIEYVNSMTDKSCLIITDIGKRAKSKYSKIYDWFYGTSIGLDFSDDYDENSGIKLAVNMLDKFSVFNKMTTELLQKFDDSILEIEVRKEKGSDSKEELVVYTKHSYEGKDDKWLPLERESGGTKKIFALTIFLLYSIETGRVLLADELDSKLHPLVLRYIVQMFTDKKINFGSGQLIFSAHNLICLDSSDLRRDEIWFVEKNNQKSTLYSLYDFKEDDCSIRSDLSFGKNYLSGRFGAIPFQTQV